MVGSGIAPGLLILLLCCSCASSETVQVSYDPASGITAYTSARFLMGYRDMSGGLATGQRVMWQAVASCLGEDCTPQEITLVFYNDSDSELNIDARRLQLTFNGTTRDWEDLSRLNEPAHHAVSRGAFFQVPLTSVDFVRLATAREVEVVFGTTGTSIFKVPFERRAPFRAFAGQTVLQEEPPRNED